MPTKRPTATELAMSFSSEVRLRPGGWAVVHPPGWDSHEVLVQVERVGGEVRAVGLQLLPRADHDRAVTHTRLRGLPVQTMADVVAALSRPTDPEMWAALQRLGERGEPQTKVERAAAAWLKARDETKPPRAAVCEALQVSPRMADNYIRQARAAGLLPPARPKGAAKGTRTKTSKTTTSKITKKGN